MRCPFCGSEETQVKDSRSTEDGAAIRRRRSCPDCEQRFTTFERVQLREMTVLKSGNRRQPFDADKIIRSMQVALQKRPVELADIEKAAAALVRHFETQGEADITAGEIGEQVMKALIELDVVGYIRYASVYNDFRDPEDFKKFLDDMHGRKGKSTRKTG